MLKAQNVLEEKDLMLIKEIEAKLREVYLITD
jgi:hypothetical protein